MCPVNGHGAQECSRPLTRLRARLTDGRALITAHRQDYSPPGEKSARPHSNPAANRVNTLGHGRSRHIQRESYEEISYGLRGIGMLRSAGVEREVALDLTTVRKEAALTINGEGADPHDRLRHHAADGDARHAEDVSKVTITFDTQLTVPLT
jgi:hypothetical protein